jgi:hypothetical protein
MIVFSSAAGPDIMMFDEVGRRMLELLGKDPAEKRGVVTPEQLPHAISALQKAIAADRAQTANVTENTETEAVSVGLAQRALPLLELLQLAQARGKPVLWGV